MHTQWFFRFLLFFFLSVVICSLNPLFFSLLFFSVCEKKSQMNWCGEIVDPLYLFVVVTIFYFVIVVPISNYILLFFNFFLWYSLHLVVVCLNHSLLTYKVCLNKHVPRFQFHFFCFDSHSGFYFVCTNMWKCLFYTCFSFLLNTFEQAYCILMLQLTAAMSQINHSRTDRHTI